MLPKRSPAVAPESLFFKFNQVKIKKTIKSCREQLYDREHKYMKV